MLLECLRPVIGAIEAIGPLARVHSNFSNGIKRLPVRIG